LASKFNDANVACFISDGFRIGGVAMMPQAGNKSELP